MKFKNFYKNIVKKPKKLSIYGEKLQKSDKLISFKIKK